MIAHMINSPSGEVLTGGDSPGVTAAAGFRAAGVTAGLKASGRPDLALVVNDGPRDSLCAVFTSNRVVGEPVKWSREVAADGHARAVVLNSGGANVCTGPAGYADVEATAATVAGALGLQPTDVLVASTGLIGERLPVDRLLGGVAPLVGALSADGGGAGDGVSVAPAPVAGSVMRTAAVSGASISTVSSAAGCGRCGACCASQLV